MSATYLAFSQVAFAGPTRIYLLSFYCHCLQLDLDTTATRELENIDRKIHFSIFSFSQLLTEMGFSNGTSDQSYRKQLKIYFVISGNSYDLFLGFRVWPEEKLCGTLWRACVLRALCPPSHSCHRDPAVSAKNDQVISVLCSLCIKNHQIIW